MSSKLKGNWLHWFLFVGFLVIVGIIFTLGRIAISQAERKDAEKKRGDLLQQSVNALRNRSDEDRKFFEIVRQLIVANGEAERTALINKLREFQFKEGTSTDVSPSKTTPSATTSTTRSIVTTPTTRASPTSTTSPSSTTTTTTTQPKSSPPSSIFCITTPVQTICR